MKTKRYIQNLKCGGCQKTITDTLKTLTGIENIRVSTVDGSVTFDYAEKMDTQIVTDKLAKIGYPIDGEKNTLLHKASSYVSCAIGRIK